MIGIKGCMDIKKVTLVEEVMQRSLQPTIIVMTAMHHLMVRMIGVKGCMEVKKVTLVETVIGVKGCTEVKKVTLEEEVIEVKGCMKVIQKLTLVEEVMRVWMASGMKSGEQDGEVVRA